MKIRFTPNEPLPTYGNDVEELYLEIDSGDGFKPYIVREHHHGEGPVIAADDPHRRSVDP
jgi:hypothetical protein